MARGPVLEHILGLACVDRGLFKGFGPAGGGRRGEWKAGVTIEPSSKTVTAAWSPRVTPCFTAGLCVAHRRPERGLVWGRSYQRNGSRGDCNCMDGSCVGHCQRAYMHARARPLPVIPAIRPEKCTRLGGASDAHSHCIISTSSQTEAQASCHYTAHRGLCMQYEGARRGVEVRHPESPRR